MLQLADRLKAEVVGVEDWTSERSSLPSETRQPGSRRPRLPEMPNLPLDDVPEGRDEHDNVEIRRWGQRTARLRTGFVPRGTFNVLGEALGLMDFDTAAQICPGARFVVLRGGLARLERALGQFMLDLHTGEHGYEEIDPPLTWCGTQADVRHRAACRSFATTMFRAGSTTHWLIPTAEVPLTNLARERVLDESGPAATLHRTHSVVPGGGWDPLAVTRAA